MPSLISILHQIKFLQIVVIHVNAFNCVFYPLLITSSKPAFTNEEGCTLILLSSSSKAHSLSVSTNWSKEVLIITWIRIQVHYKIGQINALSLLSTHSSHFSIPLETNFKMHQLSCKGAQSQLWVEAAENWCQEILQWIHQQLALGCNLGTACFDKWMLRR